MRATFATKSPSWSLDAKRTSFRLKTNDRSLLLACSLLANARRSLSLGRG